MAFGKVQWPKKVKRLSSFTHPRVVPNNFPSSAEHKEDILKTDSTGFVHIKSVEFKITLNTIDFQCMDKKHWGIFYLLCSTEERKSYRFGMSKWWQMFNFDWTTH